MRKEEKKKSKAGILIAIAVIFSLIEEVMGELFGGFIAFLVIGGAIFFVVIANMKKGASGKTEVVFNGKFKSAVNRITDEKLNLIDGNKIIVEYDDFDYSLIELKK